MRTLQFRPLRRVKKTGKIVVASYREWNKVFAANYRNYQLQINAEYRGFNTGEFVYNHKGELLYFYQYNPNGIPVFEYGKDADIRHLYKVYGVQYDKFIIYMGDAGVDCAGTPCFSHYTDEYIGTHRYDPNEFEPLTVGKVLEWYEWFIYRLDNATITCK